MTAIKAIPPAGKRRIQVDVTADARQRIKAEAALKDIDMGEVVTRLAVEYLPPVPSSPDKRAKSK